MDQNADKFPDVVERGDAEADPNVVERGDAEADPDVVECGDAEADPDVVERGDAEAEADDAAWLSNVKSSEAEVFMGDFESTETRKCFFFQTCLPFLIAGCGMVAAGVLLEHASTWTFLTQMPEALILIPPLLGLKGNLGMTLASRLSTMAHAGLLDLRHQQLTAFYASVALDQAQAIVVALIASLLAVCAHYMEGNEFDFARAFCILLSGTMSASLASLALSSLMVFLVIVARRYALNPDNIATPIAAATGDVASLAFLITFGTLFYHIRYDCPLILLVLFTLMLGIAALGFWTAAQEPLTRHVLKCGWFAVLAAMVISSSGGYVLRLTITYFSGIGLLQPVINGVGGNLVAVQASRLSTYLHQIGEKGVLPGAKRLISYANPVQAFACREFESQSALILLAMSVPGHLCFLGLMLIGGEMWHLSFLAIYLCAAVIQVATLLYTCQLLCRVLWRFHCDPDHNAIPLLTAQGDLLGTCLLALAFLLHAKLFPELLLTGGQEDGVVQRVSDQINATVVGF